MEYKRGSAEGLRGIYQNRETQSKHYETPGMTTVADNMSQACTMVGTTLLQLHENRETKLTLSLYYILSRSV